MVGSPRGAGPSHAPCPEYVSPPLVSERVLTPRAPAGTGGAPPEARPCSKRIWADIMSAISPPYPPWEGGATARLAAASSCARVGGYAGSEGL